MKLRRRSAFSLSAATLQETNALLAASLRFEIFELQPFPTFTLRSVQAAWRPARSSRSGDSRQFRRHCHRENTRETKSGHANKGHFESFQERRKQDDGHPSRAEIYDPAGAKSRWQPATNPNSASNEKGTG